MKLVIYPSVGKTVLFKLLYFCDFDYYGMYKYIFCLAA